MNTLRIRNWDKWQSYRKDRGTPPWIKVHRRLMHDPAWVELTDAQRGQLVAIWMLAAERNGVIPASARHIQKICHLDTEPNLQLFVSLGFIEPDASVASDGCQSDAKVTPQRRGEADTEVEVEEEREEGANAPAAANGHAYAFSGKVLRLNAKDHATWNRVFSHLDLDAELLARDEWLVEHPESRKNWFASTSKYLANRNMEARAKQQAPPQLRRSALVSTGENLIEEFAEKDRARAVNESSRKRLTG